MSSISEKAQGNYPPPGDTTSEGGYGGQGTQSFAPVSQRGLIDQTTAGQPLGNEIEDAFQGGDEETQRNYDADRKRAGGQGLNPYGDASAQSKGDAAKDLAAGATDTRSRTYQDEIPDSQ